MPVMRVLCLSLRELLLAGSTIKKKKKELLTSSK
jgi:hypothetical protein